MEIPDEVIYIIGVIIGANFVGLWFLYSKLCEVQKKMPSLSEKIQLEGAEKNRLATALPCPIGWYAVCDSEELPNGKIIPFHAAGVDLAVWRGQSGKVYSIDAYCPHLGANIAYGEVRGEQAACPFHLWCFDKTGKCSEIWYNNNPIPKAAEVRGYHTVDWAGRVWFYYHPDKIDQPDYEFPSMDYFKGRYVVSGIKRDMNTHAWEVLENCSDPIHFDVLHKTPWLIVPGLKRIAERFTQVLHEVIECDEEDWILHFKEAPCVRVCGIQLPTIVTVHTRFVGITCHMFEFTIKGLGKACMVKSLTQVSPLVAVERDIWYVDQTIPRAFIWYLQGQARIAFDEDFVAWEKKQFLRQPIVVKGDGLIQKRRRWSKRFFPHGTELKPNKEYNW